MHKIILVLSLFLAVQTIAQPINRKALVERHKVVNTKTDTLASLTVGNGRFAFTTDITGLQSFPLAYEKGVPLGTQSEWGWHSFTDTANYRFEESLRDYELNGRKVSYSVQWNGNGRNKDAASWFRQNPHRLQLGNIGLRIRKKDGSEAILADLTNIHQELNPWTGIITSHFEVEGQPVDVITAGHQQQDAVAAKISSPLIAAGRLEVFLRFPYPTGEWTDVGTNYKHPEKHQSQLVQRKANSALLQRKLDKDHYFVGLSWEGTAKLQEAGKHHFVLQPNGGQQSFSFAFVFSPDMPAALPHFAGVNSSSVAGWKAFWSRGGAIDFAGSTDKRAHELERRIILSQYLTKVQCSGAYPPQETGLTYNSWFGKPHLEMHYWHGIHFALWGRTDLLENSLGWYRKVANKARGIAQRQGYKGVRWQKMVDHNGDESPSSVGAFLVWQQPHLVYFAELVYRNQPTAATLNRYKDLVFATADFMASYPVYDSVNKRYVLGKGLIPAQERFKPEETYNPPYELAYWYWTLKTAQEWRKRLGMQPERNWQIVMEQLSPLPQKDGIYLAAESAPDSYTRAEFITDHPSVLGTLGMVAKTPLVDSVTMRRTFDHVWKVWHWPDTWGWDFPMVAMSATRLGIPDKAIEGLLMPIKTNTYLPNGHNYQDDRLRLYLPGNGGVLAAAAMMVAGYDGATQSLPGIPKDGSWKVRWEGLRKMP
jgi:protein-glucosylgalactosylhydroxylysine glucosidase